MKNTIDFHIVVIDDKDQSCKRINERLSGIKISIDSDTDILVSVSTVHVTVERNNQHTRPELDFWTFSTDTLEQILQASSKPADLLIVDYIYIDNEVAIYFKSKAKSSKVEENDIENRALNPKILRDWILQPKKLTTIQQKQILTNLFNTNSTVYLHSYTPQGLYAATGTMEHRYRMGSLAFPKAKINLIDTRSELFNDEEFDWPREDSKYDSNYYPYQLAVLFAQIVQKEILKTHFSRKPKSSRVFLVHGKAEKERDSVARFIEKFSLEVIILEEQSNLGRSVLKKFRDYSDVGFAVVLLTGDDKGGLSTEDPNSYSFRARQNVILELGFFLAKLGDERVCCISSPGVEIPSEYLGILNITFDSGEIWKTKLAKELKANGFEVDLNRLLL